MVLGTNQGAITLAKRIPFATLIVKILNIYNTKYIMSEILFLVKLNKLKSSMVTFISDFKACYLGVYKSSDLTYELY